MLDEDYPVDAAVGKLVVEAVEAKKSICHQRK
jgi:hypothetical protein